MLDGFASSYSLSHFLMSFLFLFSESTKNVSMFSLYFSMRKINMILTKRIRIIPKKNPVTKKNPKYFLSACFFKTSNIDHELCSGDSRLSQWLCCEMWKTDIVSDLYIAVWKDPNSCKQHCNQCPICSHVPLVWMPFCHFFHPLPSGCLRTSNPEKRAHLPKEERSKLDF